MMAQPNYDVTTCERYSVDSAKTAHVHVLKFPCSYNVTI